MRYKYTKFVGDPFEGIDLEDLVSKLSDLMLASGFDDPYDSLDSSRTQSMQNLYDAILDALLNGGLLSDDAIERLMGDPADADSRSQLEQLVDRLVEGLAREALHPVQPDQGTLQVRIAEDDHVLGPGDSIYFDAGIPHGYRRHDREACSAVVVTTTFATKTFLVPPMNVPSSSMSCTRMVRVTAPPL